LFVGDLDDPWVVSLAEAMPAGSARFACAQALPESWPETGHPGAVLVLHRATLGASDASRLARARQEGRFGRVVLCVGPHARYHQVQRWAAAGLVDVVLSEATAAEILPRAVAGNAPRAIAMSARTASRETVAVVSGLAEMKAYLAEAVLAAGYPSRGFRAWEGVPDSIRLAVWDVPTLETGWEAEMARATARGRRVVALLGLAERELVTRARAAGVAACLDQPCDPADLAFVIDRVAAARTNAGAIENTWA
jgi:CheY-like chemotaxis protein